MGGGVFNSEALLVLVLCTSDIYSLAPALSITWHSQVGLVCVCVYVCVKWVQLCGSAGCVCVCVGGGIKCVGLQGVCVCVLGGCAPWCLGQISPEVDSARCSLTAVGQSCIRDSTLFLCTHTYRHTDTHTHTHIYKHTHTHVQVIYQATLQA